ncbi:RluA family pseudouridine synthase [Celerinatantimonas sp. YJH-8]|uniref:RluA family pseudouridine synthase n=1 Tax=Celerinatantimonas sp. YJH-8 TaxID=3228714 RepID=UPI0038CA760D
MTDFIYQPPQHPYLPIIYQDDDIAVFNKPSGLLSVPGREKINRDSLAIRAMRVWPDIRVVHRLDMATSGLIVMAMNRAAQSHLSRQFQQRQTQKRYLAEVWGLLYQKQGSVDLPLRCDWPNRPRQMVDHQLGKKALTHWQVKQYRELTTIVELKPVTGRSHQLRVHMQQLGHPIVGDQIYAPKDVLAYTNRLHLHATELGFYHPHTNEWLAFKCDAAFAEGV